MSKNKSPWLWVPTLYFAEGIPYFIVNVVSVTMFKRMGMGNADLAMYTSLLYLPWVIKPLWSPLVDVVRTKRWWIAAAQDGSARWSIRSLAHLLLHNGHAVRHARHSRRRILHAGTG